MTKQPERTAYHAFAAADAAVPDLEDVPPQCDQTNTSRRFSFEGAPLPIFPCRPNKKPLTEHGFKDAVHVRHDSNWPLVGVPTGVKFDVLDVDPRNGGTAWYEANFDALPLTRCHQTRGGGVHLLFRPAPGLRCTDRIAPGIDVKAKGGYVIWWPREGLPFEDRPLCEWPEWLLQEAMQPKARSAERREPITLPCMAEVAELTEALAKLDPTEWRGQFDRWFVLMAACRFVGIDRDAWIEWCLRDPHYAGDAEVIARQWEGLAPTHGGAFWAALSEAGIKITPHRQGRDGNGHPTSPRRPAISRLDCILIQRAVERAPGANREPVLSWGSRRMRTSSPR